MRRCLAIPSAQRSASLHKCATFIALGKRWQSRQNIAEARSVALSSRMPKEQQAIATRAHEIDVASRFIASSDAESQHRALSNEQLHSLLFQGGRRDTTAHHVSSVSLEVLRRAQSAPAALVRDAIYMCGQHRLHRMCLDLFIEKQKGALSQDSRMPVYEVVVDAAYNLGLPDALEELALEAVNAVRLWHSDISEIALFRCFWRMVMLHVDLLGSKATMRDRNYRPAPSSLDARRESIKAAAARVFQLIAQVNRSFGEQASFDVFFTSTVAIVRYCTGRDAGEMRYFQTVFDQFLSGDGDRAASKKIVRLATSTQRRTPIALVNSSEAEEADVVDVPPARRHLTAGAAAGLLRTCKESACTDQMRIYVTRYLADVAELAASSSEGLSSSTPTKALSEVVIHTYVQALLDSRHFKRVVDFVREAESQFIYTPSASVLTVVARAAGELRDRALATACLERELASSPPPTSFEVFMTLVAIAKSGTPTFPDVLQSCATSGVFKVTDEEVLFLLVQYAFNSPDPVTNLTAVLQSVPQDSPLWSPRIRNLVLQVHSKFHTDSFLGYFDQFVAALRPGDESDRRKYGEMLLRWASLRRYDLVPETRSGIVSRLADCGIVVDDRRNSGEVERRLRLLLWDHNDRTPEAAPEKDDALRCFVLRQGRVLRSGTGSVEPLTRISEDNAQLTMNSSAPLERLIVAQMQRELLRPYDELS